MSFPYEQHFRKYLQTEKFLEDITINDICHDVSDLFIHLRNFNPIYRENSDLSLLEQSDIKDYFNMLQVKREIKNSTYNKVLTHLNSYFIFLFSHKLTTSMPTLTLKGLAKQETSITGLDWTTNLTTFLTDQSLSYYTRLMLLLLSKFYTINEILQPNFYQILANCELSVEQQKFLTEFMVFIAPLQELQNCQDLFLKQRINLANPRLSLPGLHKFLKKDQAHCSLILSPQKLYQSAILYHLNTHLDTPTEQLLTTLRLNPTSLIYYKKQAALL